MGYDCGFEIFPRLRVAIDRDAYRAFISEILSRYSRIFDEVSRHPDLKILELPTDASSSDKHNIHFTVGEYPGMPLDPEHCEYFLRFSSKVSGHLSAPADPYIRQVCRIARKHFGEKVCWWHEASDKYGHYGWQEIHDAAEELKKKEVPAVTSRGRDMQPPICSS
jgi:hypothetical protein